MCGRYRLSAKERYIRDHFGLDEDPPWTPRYNIAPTQLVATIRQDAKEPKRAFGLLRWGLIPFWTLLANSRGPKCERLTTAGYLLIFEAFAASKLYPAMRME
jgi:putative SOS response-associated peptidase YedK